MSQIHKTYLLESVLWFEYLFFRRIPGINLLRGSPLALVWKGEVPRIHVNYDIYIKIHTQVT
jgi:hypothetical protein